MQKKSLDRSAASKKPAAPKTDGKKLKVGVLKATTLSAHNVKI
jgi:hypothetical protein